MFTTTTNQDYLTPAVNIRESEKDILLDAEMPGLNKDSITVVVTGDELTITGKCTAETLPEGYTATYRERECSDYYRKFKLNVSIDRDRVNAEYKNGVLKVALPKSEETTPKKIVVQ